MKILTRGRLYQLRRIAPRLIYSPRVDIFAINLLTIRYTLYCIVILKYRECEPGQVAGDAICIPC